MAEFKFPCPLCKQRIQCDAGYVGAKINCPACGQSITVPPMTPAAVAPGERVIQIKASTLRTAGLIALGVLLAAGLVWLPIRLFAGPKSVTLKLYVDGNDVVKISGDRLWVEHQEWKLPARMTVNGHKWNPTWNGNTSMAYDLKRAFRPATSADIKLTKRIGRGDVIITQMPSPENNETLAVRINDDAPGADWYEFTVSW